MKAIPAMRGARTFRGCFEVAKIVITRQDLEAILLEKLRSVPYCEGATNVTVYPLADQAVMPWDVEINWTVANFNAGTSVVDACAAALRSIERDLQEVFTLANE